MMNTKQNEIVPVQNITNKKKVLLDEGSIGHFLSNEENEKMKDFGRKVHELTNKHSKKQ